MRVAGRDAKRGEEAAPARRGVLGQQRGRPAELRSRPQPLQQPRGAQHRGRRETRPALAQGMLERLDEHRLTRDRVVGPELGATRRLSLELIHGSTVPSLTAQRT